MTTFREGVNAIVQSRWRNYVYVYDDYPPRLLAFIDLLEDVELTINFDPEHMVDALWCVSERERERERV